MPPKQGKKTNNNLSWFRENLNRHFLAFVVEKFNRPLITLLAKEDLQAEFLEVHGIRSRKA